MPRTRPVLAALVLAACGGGGGDAPDAADTLAPIDAVDAVDAPPGVVPRAEPVPCRYDVDASLGVEGTAYACGDLVVWEDRVARGRTIRLHYLRFTSPAATGDAVIYLDGGPGGDGQNIVSYAAALGPSFLGGLLVAGDFVVLGQRGTARSIPYLACDFGDCSELAGQVDLTAYNTAANADDVEDLRAALGFTRLDLYGISYGSRLGLEVLRRHGDHVRAAVIEGLVPAQVTWTAAIPASFHHALTSLNASCAQAGACGTAFGDLVNKFLRGVDVLDANPVTIQLSAGDFPLDGGTYAALLFRMMYSRSSYAWLPILINDLAVRRTDRVNDFIAAWAERGGSSGVALGLYYSVVCGELYDPPTEGVFETVNAGVPTRFVEIFGGSYFGLLDFCQTWPTGDLQAGLAQPVSSSVPTLVSSGALDPITPPGFGDVAAATLAASTVVVHANSGHGATLQTPCGTQNLHAFLADPTTPHDTSCAAAITTPYILPNPVVATPVPRDRIRLEAAFAPPLPALDARLRRAAR